MSLARDWTAAMSAALAEEARIKTRLAELRAVRPELSITGLGTVCRLDDGGRLEFTKEALGYLTETYTDRIVEWFRVTFGEGR